MLKSNSKQSGESMQSVSPEEERKATVGRICSHEICDGHEMVYESRLKYLYLCIDVAEIAMFV